MQLAHTISRVRVPQAVAILETLAKIIEPAGCKDHSDRGWFRLRNRGGKKKCIAPKFDVYLKKNDPNKLTPV